LVLQKAILNGIFHHDYDSWWTDQETDSLPPVQVFDKIWNRVATRKLRRDRIGLAVSGTRKTSVVELDFGAMGREFSKEKIVEVYNTQYEMFGRVLRFQNSHLVNPARPLDPGARVFFRGHVRLRETPGPEWLAPIAERQSLTSGGMTIRFSRGGCRLFYGGVELSKSLGIYTALRSRGRFDGSYEADWNLLDKTSDSLTAEANCRSFPISQIWSFRKEKSGFAWTVTLTVHEPLEVDREQTNVMLPEGFTRWNHGTDRGTFPEGFNRDFSGDWDCRAEFQPPGEIGAFGEGLPQVTFSTSMTPPYRLRIVNSDEGFRGRVLQCVRLDRGRLEPGEYDYFSGHISVRG
jgi:hypothetical protein